MPINVGEPFYYRAGYAIYRVDVPMGGILTNDNLTQTCAAHNLSPVCDDGTLGGSYKCLPGHDCIKDGVLHKAHPPPRRLRYPKLKTVLASQDTALPLPVHVRKVGR